MSLEYKVPRILWENLESVLYAQSKRYVMELAKRLGVSEKELLKRVLPTSDSIHIMIQDSHAESNQCKAYIQQDKMTTFCKRPTAYQSEFCPVHRIKRMTLIDGAPPKIVQKIKDREEMDPTWVLGNYLFDSQAGVVGRINKEESKIKRFIVEVPKTNDNDI